MLKFWKLKRHLAESESILMERIAAFLNLRCYNTRRAYTAAIKSFLNYHKTSIADPLLLSKLNKIRVGHAAEWLVSLQAQNKSDATIAHRARVLETFFTWLINERQIAIKNPFLEIPRSKKNRPRRPTATLSPEQVQKILALPDTGTKQGFRDKVILIILFYGALRVSELANLRICDLSDLNDGGLCLTMPDTKSGHQQRAVIAELAARWVRTWAKRRRKDGATDGDYLFVDYYRKGFNRLSVETIRRLYKSYTSVLGLNASPHSARAAAITKLLIDKHPLELVQRFSRHASLSSVLVYDHRSRAANENVGLTLNYSKKVENE